MLNFLIIIWQWLNEQQGSRQNLKWLTTTTYLKHRQYVFQYLKFKTWEKGKTIYWCKADY